MDHEIFRAFEASSSVLKKLHTDKPGQQPQSKLAYEDKVVAVQALLALIKAKETEIAYRKQLILMLQKSKITFEDELQQAKTNYASLKRLTPQQSTQNPSGTGNTEEQAQSQGSLDRRLSEFLKTFPNLSQTGQDNSRSGDQPQQIPPMQPGYYTQHPPPMLTSLPAPSIMAMMSVPPPPLLPNSQPPPMLPTIANTQSQSHNHQPSSSHNHSSNSHDYRSSKRPKRK